MSVKNLVKKFTPFSVLNFYHFLLPMLGAFLYRFPSRELTVIGVTGTNGKSTVVDLATKILEENGYKVASLSSIKFKIGEKEWPNTLKMTMPGRLKLQRFLRKTVNAGCKYAVLEVTSEGMKQHRHRFIDFDCAVFTNLTPEHIESHGGFENYRRAKAELFKGLKPETRWTRSGLPGGLHPKPEKIPNSQFRKTKKISIINLDDKNAEYFLKFPADEKIGYSLKSKILDSAKRRTPRRVANQNAKLPTVRTQQFKIQKLIKAQNSQILPDGLKFSVKDVEFNLNLLGKFNISNALAAICVGLSQGIGLDTCKKALEKIEGIPGRMEVVVNKPFTVMVDYAHTPDALQKAYKTIKQSTINNQQSRMICVLGAAGGGRDKWKRPELGEIAAKYCDRVIITNEDPYNEDPMEIIEQVAMGAENISINQQNQHKSAVHKILDRREAIKKALNLARPGDAVIITGKGCEPWMCVAGGRKIPWDDRKIVKEEIKFFTINQGQKTK